MKLIVDFLERCEHKLDKMISYIYKNKSEVVSAIIEFKKGLESYMSDFSQYGLPQRRTTELVSF